VPEGEVPPTAPIPAEEAAAVAEARAHEVEHKRALQDQDRKTRGQARKLRIAAWVLAGLALFLHPVLEALGVPVAHPDEAAPADPSLAAAFTLAPLLGPIRLILAAAALSAFVGSSVVKRRAKTLPIERDLETMSVAARTRVALAVLGFVTFVSIRWWSIHGAHIVESTAFWLQVWSIYWEHVATPSERNLWTFGIAAAILAAWGLGLLLHKFVWRAFFPDLTRLDPTHHRGARAELVGRLFKVVRFETMEGATRHRLYYKHGARIFPLFRVDYVDVHTVPEPVVHGVVVIRVGRLVRDRDGHRFRREVAQDRYGGHPLLTDFREAELVEDHNRKTSIVMPGSATNPAVMRRKFETERLINPHIARRQRDARDRPLRFPRPHREGGPRHGEEAIVDRLSEPAPRERDES
jgi:hypothetical protein